jgi:hypothetical protein
MLVREAKEAAREWVLDHGQHTPGFVGAYFHGSATALPEEAEYPATSDLDVMLVLEDPGDAIKPGKFLYKGALLEASYIARSALEPPETVLETAALAGGFRRPGSILDPTGMLTALHERVSRDFARRTWVLKRCERALAAPGNAARSLSADAPLHDQVQTTVFACGLACFPPVVAALRDTTVRKRYVAAREVLAEYGRLDFQEELLELLGCAAMGRERAEWHLRGMTAAYDAAAAAYRTPYRFGSDVSAAARPISVDGTQELIDRGLHREAVFWIAATYDRARHVLSVDAPERVPQMDETYVELLRDLRIETLEKRRERCAAVEAFVPRVREVTEEILAKNPHIVD